MTTLLDAVEPVVRPAHKIEGRLVACLRGTGEGFRTAAVDSIELDHEGMPADGHRGYLRQSGSREPWYPRGTVIRSGRQLSIVSLEDLAEVADRLGIASVDPSLIGANLVVEGIPHFSYLPTGTRLVLDSGAAIVIEAMNGPCRFAGRAIADAHPGRDDIELGFVKAAMRRRGVVASVERIGTATAGTALSVRVPEQWFYGA